MRHWIICTLSGAAEVQPVATESHPLSGCATPFRGSYVSGCTRSNSRRPPRPIRAWAGRERSPSGSPEAGSASQVCCGGTVNIIGGAYGGRGGERARRFCTWQYLSHARLLP